MEKDTATHLRPYDKSEHCDDATGKLESLSRIIYCRRAERIYRQGDAIEYWYRVISGVVRTCTVLDNGRRQVVELLLPGDFFGFAGPRIYALTAEAAVHGTMVARYSRRRAEMLADSDPVVGRRIRELAFEAIYRSQTRTLVFSQVTAAKKVGRFVMDLAKRQSDDRVDHLELRISRYDIADYLGLSVETVCRALTSLQDRGVIAFAGTHRLRIVDYHALGASDEEKQLQSCAADASDESGQDRRARCVIAREESEAVLSPR